MPSVNPEARRKIRARMEELGITQAELARRITEKRGGEVNPATGKPVEITRHAVNRVINVGGKLPPLLTDVLEELGLKATVEEANE